MRTLFVLFAILAVVSANTTADRLNSRINRATTTTEVEDPNAPKGTPGRHCDLRADCVDCLAVSYCLWSPSTNKCLDKAKLQPTDDVIATCDPVVCAEHAKRDTRKSEVHEVELVNLNNDKVVTAQADEVRSPPPPPTLPGVVLFPPKPTNEAEVVIAKGTVFVSDNSPSVLINGEPPLPVNPAPQVQVTACINCASLRNANPAFVAPEYQNLLGATGLPAPIVVNGVHYQLPAGQTSGIAQPVPIKDGVHPYFHVQPELVANRHERAIAETKAKLDVLRVKAATIANNPNAAQVLNDVQNVASAAAIPANLDDEATFQALQVKVNALDALVNNLIANPTAVRSLLEVESESDEEAEAEADSEEEVDADSEEEGEFENEDEGESESEDSMDSEDASESEDSSEMETEAEDDME